MKSILFRTIVGNSIFTVTFIKQDGTIRKLNGRTGVTKYLVKSPRIRINNNSNNITVFDLKIKNYRTFNPHTMVSLKARGKEFLGRDYERF